jgi:hypothetical protein
MGPHTHALNILLDGIVSPIHRANGNIGCRNAVRISGGADLQSVFA